MYKKESFNSIKKVNFVKKKEKKQPKKVVVTVTVTPISMFGPFSTSKVNEACFSHYTRITNTNS
jgi:hypothetical protein